MNEQRTRRGFLQRAVWLALASVVVLTVAMTPALAAGFHHGKVVVANRASGDLTAIDTKTDTPMTVALPVGPNPPEPMYVVYSPLKRRVFVGDRANSQVIVLDAKDLSVEGTVATGNGIFHMWASLHPGQLWVNNDVDNTITVIDVRTLDVIETIPLPADLVAAGGKPHDVILDPIRPFAYVTMVGFGGPADYVVKYSAKTFQELDRQEVGKDPHLARTWRNGFLYVPCQNTDEVIVLDRSTLDVELTIPVPGAHGAGMPLSGRRFYTTNLPGGGTDGLFVIDTQTNSVLGSIDTPFPTPHNIALTPSGRKIYVTHSGATAEQVSVYEASHHEDLPEHLTTVTAGTNPFGITYVP